MEGGGKRGCGGVQGIYTPAAEGYAHSVSQVILVQISLCGTMLHVPAQPPLTRKVVSVVCCLLTGQRAHMAHALLSWRSSTPRAHGEE